ncbi:hypothetical protein [Halorientalis sp.]|uniref:hypothetical protein n=1 Tax=Halorientalis sp. TaxID=1931229 RepID=UPI002629ED3C|nr:hypothetical protein [Halorientalis sp.]
MSEYQPGVCNIGAAQRRRRFGYATAAAAVTVWYVAICLSGLLPRVLLVGVFVPLAVTFEWALQAASAFCIGLALFGRYDFRGSGGEHGTVPDGVRRDDRVQAAKITVAAVSLAALVTGIVYLGLV